MRLCVLCCFRRTHVPRATLYVYRVNNIVCLQQNLSNLAVSPDAYDTTICYTFLFCVSYKMPPCSCDAVRKRGNTRIMEKRIAVRGERNREVSVGTHRTLTCHKIQGRIQLLWTLEWIRPSRRESVFTVLLLNPWILIPTIGTPLL